ncbi:MAG: hypothetical protein Q7S86_05735 [bacterium]|nr:hypothetical protein [bacterium]
MKSPEKKPVSILPEGYSYHPEGYLWHILPVEKFDALPDAVNVEGQSFGKKSEFHVTVANVRGIAREIAGADLQTVSEIENTLQEILSQYVGETPISFDRFEDDLRLAVSSGRESVAARCVMKNLKGYFERIKERYGREFPLQPTHVSIYTKTGAAVGIDSVEEMESFKKVELPVVRNVLNTIRVD